MLPFQPLLHGYVQRLEGPGELRADLQCLDETRLLWLSGRNAGQTAALGRPTVGIVWSRGGKKAGDPNVSDALPRAPAAEASALYRSNADRGVEVSPPGPARRDQNGLARRRDVWSGNPGGSSNASGWAVSASRPPLIRTGTPAQPWSLAYPKLATHMSITGRRTCRPIRTQSEYWATRVVGTHACQPDSGPSRRRRARARRSPAAALTFRKSCP
jgi:hypothetical protein